MTERIAQFVVQTPRGSVPAQAISAAKEAMLDGLGCALAGSAEPVGRLVAEYVRERGGNQEASVIGLGFKTSVPQAAMVNGTMAHVLDYDDVSLNWVGHPTSVLLPAALSIGEICRSSGRELLESYVLGVELAGKVGAAMSPHHYDVGWHSTSTVGSVAAAAVAARMLGLDVERTRAALGISASLAAGLRRNFGTMTKPFHAGSASKNGVTAALLSSKGMTADADIMDGAGGFYSIWGPTEDRLTKAVGNLGSPWELVSPGLTLKMYPCCRGTHRCVDAVLDLRERYGIRDSDVAEILCTTNAIMPKVLIHSRPRTGAEAKFSMQYCIAVALLDGKVGLEQFQDARVTEPRVQDLLRKVRYVHPPGEASTQEAVRSPEAVTVRLATGSEYVCEVMTVTGEPSKPMTQQQRFRKYEECAAVCLGRDRIRRSFETVSALETLSDVSGLIDVITPDA